MGHWTVVYGDDWTGIYKDGDLLSEAGSFEEIDVLDLVRRYGHVTSCDYKNAYAFCETNSLPAALDQVEFDEPETPKEQ